MNDITTTTALAAIQGAQQYRENRIPAPLVIGGVETRLTKWLRLNDWTPVEAVLLVCGLDPESYTEEFPYYGRKMRSAVGLWGNRVMGEKPFLEFDRIMRRPTAGMDLPDKITPADFVAWCKSKGIDTGWLSAVAAPVEPVAAPSASAPAVASPEPVAASVETVPVAKAEGAEKRQDRRLVELRRMGADFVPHGDGWRATGERGALAKLVRRETGKPMGTKDGVRQDLRAAVQRERARNGRPSR